MEARTSLVDDRKVLEEHAIALLGIRKSLVDSWE